LFVFCAAVFAASTCFGEEIVKSHALAKYGEPKYPEGFERFDYTSPRAVKGGSVKIAEVGSFDSLNPFIQKGVAERNIELIYDTLMVSSADEPNTMYGLIASKVEYPENRSWIIFHLNPKAHFADNQPITANDVKFSFETLVSKGDPAYKVYYADVGEVKILSPHSIKFSISNPDNKDLLESIASLVVLPMHFWEGKDFTANSLDSPLGSGAYKIGRVDAGRSITYLRDANYWASDLNVNRGLYNFDSIQVDYYRDLEIVLEAFKSGNFDYHFELSSKGWATAYDVPAVKSGKIIRLELEDRNAQGMIGTLFNQRKPKLQNRALRQAMDLAFDFEWTNKNIFYGSYFRTESFFQNTEYQAKELPSSAELKLLEPYKDILPPEVFREAYKAPKTDGSGNNRDQLRQAKKILNDAGYKVVNGNLIDPKTQKPVEIEYLDRQQGLDRVINPWLANLKKLGITVNYRMIDQAQWINRLQSYDFDIISLVYPGFDSPGNEQALYWGSTSADTEFSSNYMGIKNPAIDKMIEHLNTAKDQESRVTAARALDRILMHSHYLVPKYHSGTNRIAYWNKFSQPDQPTTYDFRHNVGFFTWWYDEEKAKSLLNAK
jgi:microcin C transport system substrate-binding protein